MARKTKNFDWSIMRLLIRLLGNQSGLEELNNPLFPLWYIYQRILYKDVSESNNQVSNQLKHLIKSNYLWMLKLKKVSMNSDGKLIFTRRDSVKKKIERFLKRKSVKQPFKEYKFQFIEMIDYIYDLEVILEKLSSFSQINVPLQLPVSEIEQLVNLIKNEVENINKFEDLIKWLLPDKDIKEIQHSLDNIQESRKEIKKKIDREKKRNSQDAFLGDFLIGGLMVSGIFIIIDSLQLSPIMQCGIGFLLISISIIIFNLYFRNKMYREIKNQKDDEEKLLELINNSIHFR